MDILKEGPEKQEKNRNQKRLYERHVQTVLEKNMYIKAEMVIELVQMGFDLDTIEYILKVDPDTLNKLL